LRTRLTWPDNAVVVASFGDASANHSTATGAINAARWAARQGIAVPLLLVCEDNGIGVSTRTPAGWIESLYCGATGLEYLADDGEDPPESLRLARQAVETARERKVPVLLHLRCTRIGGHSSTDDETGYRTTSEITSGLLRDPLAATMRSLLNRGVADAAQIRRRWLARRDEVAEAIAEAACRPRLTSLPNLTVPTAAPGPLDSPVLEPAGTDERRRVFDNKLPEQEGALTLAETLRAALLDAGARYPELVVLGQDVARKGGSHGVTDGLRRRLGSSRVVDTLLDEQTVLGLSLGAGLSGLLPVPQIQYLAYLHNAIDQLRGEAATLRFFSQGAYRNPMVVRVPGLGYQQGAGGHFHNENAVAALREIPGLVIACPAHPSDAPGIIRSCLAAARNDGTVSVVLEPAALYHERDMLIAGDDAWTAHYAPPEIWSMTDVAIGRAATWGTGIDLAIATFGNGLRIGLRAAERLAAQGIKTRVVDLRWLAPLPVDDVLREAQACGALLVIDETRRTAGVSEGLITELLEAGYTGKVSRVTSADSFVPVGAAADLVLVGDDEVDDAAFALLGR